MERNRFSHNRSLYRLLLVVILSLAINPADTYASPPHLHSPGSSPQKTDRSTSLRDDVEEVRNTKTEELASFFGQFSIPRSGERA